MHFNELKTRLRRLFTWRNYKDRLFIRCFQDKKDLLELYNAIRGSSYTDPDMLEITTLEDCIYLSVKNDVSFIIASCMCLFEHQSTINPNMPVRGLLYFARLYDAYITRHGFNIHGSAAVKLPFPCYCVFYNGNDEIPDISYLRLSDLYCSINQSDAFRDHPLALECVATMYNINYGHNKKLMASCKRLHDYSRFVSEVRSCLSHGLDRDTAIEAATDYCIENDILRDLLTKHRSEVHDMLLTHFDEKVYRKGIHDEGYSEGYDNGREIGGQIKLISLVCIMHAKGLKSPQIADTLEEDEVLIENICRTADRFAPDYDAKMILEYMNDHKL